MNNLAFESILEKRKAEIVSAVLRLVDKVGITGLTTKRIAAEVGFAEGALYKHVDSKMGIFHLILEASLRSIEATDRDITARNLPPAAALGAWFDFVVCFLEEYPGIYRILFSDGLYAEDRTLFNKFKSCILDLNGRMRTIIEKGMASGDFRSDVDPEVKAVMYLGLIVTTFMLWTVIEERARSYKETARPYFEEYLQTLRGPSFPSAEASRG
jgi:AcrR family transcriptional regulator